MSQQKLEDILYPPGIGMSPLVIILRQQEIAKKYGEGNLLKKNEFKRAREMYQAARYSMGLTELNGKQFWLVPGPKNDTPDIYMISVIDNTKEIHCDCLELTDLEEHSGSIEEIIKKKIGKTSYPNKYTLVVHMRKQGFTSGQYMGEVVQKLKQEKIPFGAIRVWGDMDKQGEHDTIWGELYPNDLCKKFSTKKILEKYEKEFGQHLIKIDMPTKLPLSVDKVKLVKFSDEELNQDDVDKFAFGKDL